MLAVNPVGIEKNPINQGDGGKRIAAAVPRQTLSHEGGVKGVQTSTTGTTQNIVNIKADLEIKGSAFTFLYSPKMKHDTDWMKR